MIASVVLAVALATPQPWPTPLKTIVHVHSSALCTTLTQNVFAAVEGLRLNDKLADQSTHVLNRFAYGQSTAMDEMRLERLSLDMEHNFERIDAVLADAKRFPSPPKTDDDKVAAALKAQLQEVEKHQRETFNLLYGIYDTLAFNDLQSAGDSAMAHAVANTIAQSSPAPAPQAVPTPGLPAQPGSALPPSVTAPVTTFGNNPYSSLIETVAAYQSQTQITETPAIATIQQVVQRCK